MTMRFAILVIALALFAACGDDASKQGFRTPCSVAAGGVDSCDVAPLETTEDVCWRLVDCGAIPVEDPSDNDSVFDWQDCMSRVGGMEEYQFEYSSACVQLSTCDELKRDGSPNRPFSVPLCLLHGDQ